MRPLRWIFVAIALLAVAALAVATIFRMQISQMAFNRAVEHNLGHGSVAALDDGIHVFVCGAGTPLPDPMRGGPCLAVIAGDTHIVIDAGSGGVRTLTRMGYPVGEIDAVFLSHLHSDHMDGLGELLMQAWVNGGRDVPLPVYGPEGVQELVSGFNAAYRIDSTYRTAHHGTDIANPEGRGGAPVVIGLPPGPDGRAVVFDEGGVTVTAIRVDHSPVDNAFGFRIDYKGRSVAISGDTVYSANLVAASKGADLMFHEALNPSMVASMHEAALASGRTGVAQILNDILTYHATPEDAARSAEEAGVSRLVFYHTIPPLPSRALNALFMKDAKSLFSGKMEVAEDGLVYSLPVGSRAIDRKKAF